MKMPLHSLQMMHEGQPESMQELQATQGVASISI